MRKWENWTLKEKYEAGLRVLGWKHIRFGASKDKWEPPINAYPDKTYVFVGVSGSVRIGKTVTNSRPVHHAFKTLLVETGFKKITDWEF